MLDTWEAQYGGAQERFSQLTSQIATPLVDAATDAARAFNEAYDQSGLLEGLHQAGLSIVGSAADALDEGITGIGDWIGGAAEKAKQGLGDFGSALKEATGELAEQALITTEDKNKIAEGYAELTRQINEALESGDVVAAASLTEAREIMYGSIGDIQTELADGMAEAGKGGANALADTRNDWKGAGTDNAADAIQAVTDKQSDMTDAGEALGGAGKEGLEEGLEGAYAIGEAAADGAVSGMSARNDEAYAAGAALGGAFVRGYRQKMQIHSPSRVMYEEAEYTTAGLFERFDEDEERLREAAAGLAQATIDGYRGASLSRTDSGGGSMASIDYDELGQAMRQAVAGLVVAIGARPVGAILEPYISQETSLRAAGSILGQGAATRSW